MKTSDIIAGHVEFIKAEGRSSLASFILNARGQTPQNSPRTGNIDMGEHGFTFAGTVNMAGRYAFSPRKGDTQWFKTYAEALTVFCDTAPKQETLKKDDIN